MHGASLPAPLKKKHFTTENTEGTEIKRRILQEI
jgi:hypothetical protein